MGKPQGRKFSVDTHGLATCHQPKLYRQIYEQKVVGTVKNNSKKAFSVVKIEFIVYDEDGNQIAIVSSNHYDFKPDGIWRFEIPVTEDVKKAEFKGLYVLS